MGVGDVFGALDLVGLATTIVGDLLAGESELLGHLVEDDLVDFEVVGGHAVVEEGGREHDAEQLHVVVGLVLRVEVQLPDVIEPRRVKDQEEHSAAEPEGPVVERPVQMARESVSDAQPTGKPRASARR